MLVAAASLYQVPKSGGAKSDFGTSGHCRWLRLTGKVWLLIGVLSSIVTSGLDGTVVELYAVEVSQPYSPETNWKKQRRKISIQPLSLHDAANNQRLEMSHDAGHRTINMLRPTRNAQLVVSTATCTLSCSTVDRRPTSALPFSTCTTSACLFSRRLWVSET